MIEIRMTDGSDRDFIDLCGLLDATLNEVVGGHKQREQYDQYNQHTSIRDVIIISVDGIPAACGGFKRYADGIAEVKRVYVKDAYRGRGLSKIIMEELEKQARSQGFSKFCLETGSMFVPAVNLYTSIGFTRIENYGQYKEMKESICFEKSL